MMHLKRHIVITGPINSGKTTMLFSLCSRLDSLGFSIGGVTQVMPLPNKEKRSYILSDQGSGDIRVLMTLDSKSDWIPFGRFHYDPGAFDWASEKILSHRAHYDYVTIDEIGPLELQEEGLAQTYKKLLHTYRGTLITVIREGLLDQVLAHFDINERSIVVLRTTENQEEQLDKVVPSE
jgi:nucleoside-triphosphatase THEP1